jgi:hypothetical protein
MANLGGVLASGHADRFVMQPCDGAHNKWARGFFPSQCANPLGWPTAPAKRGQAPGFTKIFSFSHFGKNLR